MSTQTPNAPTLPSSGAECGVVSHLHTARENATTTMTALMVAVSKGDSVATKRLCGVTFTAMDTEYSLTRTLVEKQSAERYASHRTSVLSDESVPSADLKVVVWR